jgi:hypothetical protein
MVRLESIPRGNYRTVTASINSISLEAPKTSTSVASVSAPDTASSCCGLKESCDCQLDPVLFCFALQRYYTLWASRWAALQARMAMSHLITTQLSNQFIVMIRREGYIFKVSRENCKRLKYYLRRLSLDSISSNVQRAL